jgi:phenylpropionate dioxygenase-like ring-hydroxylating dioxygenase large terminal subunit
MTRASPPQDVRLLVREDSVHSSIYTDPGIFELEMERLFGRSWILVGHTSQVPEAGAYVTSRLGREPVLIVRGDDGEVRVFHNRCTHRGAKLCMMPRGVSRRFTCPYHGWTYDTAGNLRALPAPEEYPADFKLADHGLKSVPRVAVYRGFIFANNAADGPDLMTFLGHMRTSIDDLVDRAPDDEIEVSVAPLRHRYKGNWKFTFENLNDTLHAGVAHAVAAKAASTVSARLGDEAANHPALGMMMANAKPISSFQALDLVTAESGGHSYFGGHMGLSYQPKVGDEYFSALAAARGEARAREILSVDRHVTLIYPSSTWHGRYQTVRMVHPLRADLTEVVSFACRLKGAPDGVYESALMYCNNASSALSSVITDDLEIYEAAHRMNATLDGLWLPIARGAGALRTQEVGHRRHAATSEAYIRNQYRFWSEALQSDEQHREAAE